MSSRSMWAVSLSVTRPERPTLRTSYTWQCPAISRADAIELAREAAVRDGCTVLEAISAVRLYGLKNKPK